ncbi:hypothetical protein Ctob_012170 [Chrysochromulina tobinii]|uniref:Uncharacterized protein n=1 Tax=Chrysochromulina tobinii TaxID=1460289 RepID=A0A0M0KAU8_9EUKA|nr:hypothetical protein Ctob_012170 [Chrysochromulina tobinii]|eukprot:KOO35946.1 hypothetical protein Ctob_012170 [Chrysochromulina sp. CCMP291]
MEPGEAGLLMRSAYEEMHRVLPVPKHIPQHYPDEYKQPLQLMAEFMHDRPSARRYLWEHFGNVQIRGYEERDKIRAPSAKGTELASMNHSSSEGASVTETNSKSTPAIMNHAKPQAPAI